MPTKLSLPARATLATAQNMPAFSKAVKAALGLVCLSVLEQVAAGTIDKNDNSARLALGCQSEAELNRVAAIIANMFAYGWDTVLGQTDYIATYPAEHEKAGEAIPLMDQIETQLNDPDSWVSQAMIAAILQRIPTHAPFWLTMRGEEPDATVTHVTTLSLL